MRPFGHIRTWIFDLDNTLYPPAVRLFDQIEVKMSAYVRHHLGVSRAEADRLRRLYWETHGTTLAGLMREHGTDPGPYLTEVHDIDFSVLDPDPALARAIDALPGRRIVFTNGTADYAGEVIRARGLAFDAIYGVEEAGLHPKPDRAAYDAIRALEGFAPEASAFFEDDPRNLRVPHETGMTCVHVAESTATGAHIHHHTNDLAAFLRDIAAAGFS